jgi:hypothetical protein
MTSENQIIKLVRGIPRSGKTTQAHAWVAENPGWRLRISKDDLRQQLFGQQLGLDRHQEETVATLEHAMATAALKAKLSIVVDADNLRLKDVRDWQSKAEKLSIPLEIEDVWAVPGDPSESLNLSIKRSKGELGELQVRDSFSRYVVKGKYPEIPPFSSDELAEKEWKVYTPDTSLPEAFIFDIDGTVAQMFGRSPFAWDRVGEDTPIENVIKVAKALLAFGFKIIFVSGRDEVCHGITTEWLLKEELHHEALFMRANESYIPDDIVKHEIFWNKIAPNYHVVGVFDDRLRVCRMWEEIGLTLFRVGPIDADF